MSVCACRGRGAIEVKVDAQGRGLGEDVADLRFELGVKSSAAFVEEIRITQAQLLKHKKVVGFRMILPGSLKR